MAIRNDCTARCARRPDPIHVGRGPLSAASCTRREIAGYALPLWESERWRTAQA